MLKCSRWFFVDLHHVVLDRACAKTCNVNISPFDGVFCDHMHVINGSVRESKLRRISGSAFIFPALRVQSHRYSEIMTSQILFRNHNPAPDELDLLLTIRA